MTDNNNKEFCIIFINKVLKYKFIFILSYNLYLLLSYYWIYFFLLIILFEIRYLFMIWKLKKDFHIYAYFQKHQ